MAAVVAAAAVAAAAAAAAVRVVVVVVVVAGVGIVAVVVVIAVASRWTLCRRMYSLISAGVKLAQSTIITVITIRTPSFIIVDVDFRLE